jgi:uncharacterized protein (TIGR00251 family)
MARVEIKVIPNAKKDKVETEPDGCLKVWLKAEPREGKANERLVKILSSFYNVDKGDIKIVSGLTSKKKIISLKEK